MSFLNSVLFNSKKFDDPFTHWELNQPLTKDAIQEIPDESLLYYRLVIYLMDAGKYKESINVLESALSLNFDNHEVLFDFVPNFESQSALIRVINQYKNNNLK